MKTPVNLTFGAVAVVIAIMFVQIIVLGRENAAASTRLNQAQRTVAGGQNDLAALRALASRVNEAAATDADLKALLQRLEINVDPAATASAKPTR